MNPRCLYCYLPLAATEKDFHPGCAKKIFGLSSAPELPFTEENLEDLAVEVIRSQTTVTGVQPKISLHLTSSNQDPGLKRFTIVGLWGGFILKPPSKYYPQMPEVEDLTMHLANLIKISVVPHSLIRLKSGNLAFITRRIDRIKKDKVHMEDLCQLTGKLTEDKYHSSYEQVAKTILKYSLNPGLDVVNFFETVLFSFLTGNADMHLKNFSLIHQPGFGPLLAPAYDLVATTLVNPEDDEDLALSLNGKKRKLKRIDFIAAFTSLKLDAKQQNYLFKKMESARQKWFEFIDISFLTDQFKKNYKQLLEERFKRIAN